MNRFATTVVMVLILVANTVQAASKYFSCAGGANVWNTTSSFWSTVSGGPYLTTWADNDSAIFEGTAGTVSLSSNQTAGSVTFNVAGYTLGGSGTLTLVSPATVINTADGTISCVVTGTSGLAKSGSGVLYLTGANTYSGGTTISAGVVQIGGTAGTLGFGPVAIGGNTLQINRSNAATVTNDLSGTGTFEKYVANVSTYGGTSTLTGTLQQKAEGGTFSLAPGASMTGLATVNQDSNLSTTWNVNGTLSVANFYGANVGANFTSKTVTFNVNAGGVATIGAMSISTMGWVQDSNPTTTINVSSGAVLTATTIQGQGNGGGSVGYKRVRRYINVNGGRLNATTINLSAGGTGDYVNEVRRVTLNNGTLANISGGNLTLDATTVVMLTGRGIVDAQAGRSITANGTVTSSGSLIKTGAGTLFLTHGANDYTGSTTINDGSLTVSGTGRLGSGSYAGAITNNASFVYNSSASQTLSGKISGTGSLVQLGSGVLTLAGRNTYSGDTVISGATLMQGASNSLCASSVHNIGSAGTLNTGNLPGSVLALTGSGTLNLGGAVANLTIADGGGMTFSGPIIGVGILTKAGSGTQTLGGSNSFTGGTVVTGGLLIVTNNNSGLGADSGLTLAGGSFVYRPSAPGALNLGSGALTLADGSRIGTMMGGGLSQSAITSTGAATVAGTITVDVQGILGASITAGTNDLIAAGSGLTSGGATYVLGSFRNVGNFTVGSLITSDTAISITATSAVPLTSAFWKGGFAGASNAWALSDASTAGNWASDQDGTVSPLIPGSSATVTFSATGAVNQDAMVLGDNMTIAGLVFNDPGTVALNADGNTLAVGTGGITVNGGAGSVTLGCDIALGAAQTWTNGSENALTLAGTVANRGFPLTTSGSGNTIISGVLGGSGGVTKIGAGTLSFTGVSTYTGNTTNRVGTLAISGAGKLGNGNYAGTITNSATLVYDSSASQTFSGVVNGSGFLSQSGVGTLTLSGANIIYAGDTSVNQGTLRLSSATGYKSSTTVNAGGTLALNGVNWGLTAGAIILNGGTLLTDENGGYVTENRVVTISSNSMIAVRGTGTTGNLSQLFIDAGLFSASPQTLTLDCSAANHGIVFRNTAGTFSGTLVVNGQGLGFTGRENINMANGTTQTFANVDLVLNNGSWNIGLGSNGDANTGGNNFKVKSLAGTGYVVSDGRTNTLTVGLNDGSGSFSGVIGNGTGGILSLIKTGAGTQILSGRNAYTGATTINAGILVVNGSLAAGSVVAVNAGSTLSGTGTVSGTVTANAGSTLAPGNSVGTLRTGSLILNAGCTNVFEFDAGTPTNDVVAVINSNGLTINGGLVLLYQAGTTNAWTTEGTYTLMTFSGSWNGSGSLQVANPVVGLNYFFNTVGNAIQLTIINSGTSVWTGGGTNDLWQTQENWGGVLPVSSSILVFDTSTRTENTNDFTAGTSFAIIFTNTAGAFTLNGNTVALVGDVVNQSANAQVINHDLILGSDTRNVLATGPVMLNGALSGGGIVKTGAGTLSLTGDNTYGGPSVVNGGMLKVNNSSGSATGSGAVTVNSGAVLGGAGAMAGPVTVNAGGTMAAGNGVGTLSAGSLTLVAGSTNWVEFDPAGSNDTVVLAGGLINNGCAVFLYTNGTTDAWANPGTYTLFQFTGPLGGAGLAAFSVANPVAGLTYYFTTNGPSVQVIIGGLPTWTGEGPDDNWTTGGNWISGIAPAPGRSLIFGTTSNRTVNVNDFAAGSPFGFTFANTAGSFTLNGQPILLSGDVVNLSPNAQTINNDLLLTTGSRMVTNVAGPVTFNGVLSGSYGLTKAGAGTVTLTAANTYTFKTTINAGKLVIDGSGVLGGGSYAGAIVNNGALVYNSSATQTFGGIVSGTGSVAQTAGQVTLNAANTYTGGTVVNGGKLALNATAAIPNNTVLTINSGATVSLSQGNNAIGGLTSITINGGTLSADGGASQAQTLLAANGTITLNGGVMCGNGNLNAQYGQFWLGDNMNTTVISTGDVQSIISGQIHWGRGSHVFNVYDGAAAVDLLISGQMGNLEPGQWGYITKTGPGTMAISNPGNWQAALTVSAGKVTFMDSMAGLSQGGIANNSMVDVICSAGSNVTFAYVMSGSGTLTKLGGGTLSVSGTNTCTGVTRISEGVLRLGVAGSALSTNCAVVLAGGTLDVRSYSNVLGRLTVETGNSTIWMGTNNVATLQFKDSSATNNVWEGGVSLIGTLGSNSVRIGTTKSGLRFDQLGHIDWQGRRVLLDDQGYVVLAAGTLIMVQ